MIPDDQLRDLKSRLSAEAEAVCRHLLPNGKKKGGRWVAGDSAGSDGDSLSVILEGTNAGTWKDFATDQKGDLIALWQSARGVSFMDAVKQAAGFVGSTVNGSGRKGVSMRFDYVSEEPKEPTSAICPVPVQRPRRAAGAGTFDWQEWVDGMTFDETCRFSGWRKYSLDFVEWLKREELIGCKDGLFAMPVHDDLGSVARAHVRQGDGSFRYVPKDGPNAPLVIGEPSSVATTFVFESQWDAFAVLDALGHHESPFYYSAIITRGANSNLDIGKLVTLTGCVIAVPQNDPPSKRDKEGLTPADRWLKAVRKAVPENVDFRIARCPEEHKDPNDWIRDKAPERREVEDRLITSARSPDIRPFMTVDQLLDYPIGDDPKCLIGQRWLCKGGSMLLVGSSGVGKSTLSIAMAFKFALGEDFMGITPKRPLRQIVIQAENDEGDVAEMVTGAITGMFKTATKFDRAKMVEKVAMISKNVKFVRISDVTGEDFCKTLERQIRFHRAEVVWGDPLLSFVGDDLGKQEVASAFLRNHLNPVLERTECAIVWVHHTPKPPKSNHEKGNGKMTYTDLAYFGIGSSEVTNWARGVMAITGTEEEGVFCFALSKRGKRARMTDMDGTPCCRIWMRQGNESEGMVWIQVPEPDNDDGNGDSDRPKRGRPPVDYSDLIRSLDFPCSHSGMKKQIAERLGCNIHTAGSIVSRYIKAKAVYMNGNGQYLYGGNNIRNDEIED